MTIQGEVGSESQKAPRKRVKRVAISLLLVTSITLAVFAYWPLPRSYNFITIDHPAELLGNPSNKWEVFYFANSSLEKFADSARSELVPQGYTEDKSMRPWVQFRKGNQEVIVCYFFDVSVGTSKGYSGPKPIARVMPFTPAKQDVLVWVKNGPSFNMPFQLYNLKKFLRRW